jgi:NAD(P)-dependent dehydrogenase (short-subunit alcohol dehydrogenase family)
VSGAVDFDGRGAIVTGGASGIGRAVAELLAERGARVAVFDRDADGARAVADAVGGHAYEVDVRDGAAVADAIDAAAGALGDCSILVNNAGVGDLRPLHTVDERLWRRLLDVNLTGTYHGLRCAIPKMVEAGRGAVVNVASLSGLAPTRNEAPYSAAKAAVIALTKSAALEYGPAVRVNCVAPGFVRTPLTAIWDDHPDAFAPIRESIPLRRIGEASEIAELVAFLCSDRASYVTGQTIVIDGGLSLPQAGTDAALAKLFDELQGG